MGLSGAKATCSIHGSPAGWRNESASADFHELRQGFIPPTQSRLHPHWNMWKNWKSE
jgi:hypothetical protein